ncbi:N-acetylneuraminate synthase family protein [Alteromonas sp. H39]|uniref:N-acetylneuraminate synthase family protein n=1 Tax=Alteromonas sp. H39 TaxID=3389876 RepID=UPI0039DF557F
MIIDRDIEQFTLLNTASVAEALQKLNKNKHQILFVADSRKHLRGCFTDGDFRRWVLKQSTIDLSQSVQVAMNANCMAVHEEQDSLMLESMLNERIRCIPVLNHHSQIIGVARRTSPVISIDNHVIAPQSKTFVIAEIGNNHNGSLKSALKLIDHAVAAGADCVKFQMRDLDSLYINKGDDADPSEDLGSQYVLELLNKYQLGDDAFKQIADYCLEKQITFLCTPFDQVSCDKLDALEVPAFKMASADLTNHPLLLHTAKKHKPMIISTGMATDEEIEESVALLKAQGARFVLLHCNSTYPAPFKDVNLKYLQKLATINQGLIGYSGHERDIHVAVAAVALGAKVIEKHFTLDRNQEGNDHKVSLLPNEFAAMVKGIRQVEQAIGSGASRTLSQGEMINREVLGKSLYAACNIAQGTVITRDMIEVKSPGKGLSPNKVGDLVGKVATRDVNRGGAFFTSDISETRRSENLKFALPGCFGIPVRYHDVRLAHTGNMGLVEFHLSFKDLDLTPSDYLQIDNQRKVVVHAPELFAQDHTLDLASPDTDYRSRSVEWLNRVFDVAREIGKFYPTQKCIPVVVNAGGFSQDAFVDEATRERMYKVLGETLTSLRLKGIDLLIQTMPPFPWHFGGQRYHNLFVDPHETAQFADTYDVNLCLDVSHSWLAANFLDIEIESFFTLLGDRVKHLHIADAKGVDDEGLQIGTGEIPFTKLFSLMQRYCPDATWLPEIWQGHKNEGEGFWQAFDALQDKLDAQQTPLSVAGG